MHVLYSIIPSLETPAYLAVLFHTYWELFILEGYSSYVGYRAISILNKELFLPDCTELLFHPIGRYFSQYVLHMYNVHIFAVTYEYV